MADQEYDIELIERYVNGEMTEEELRVFEQEIGNDSELSVQVELFNHAKRGIEDHAVRQKLAQFHEELIHTKTDTQVGWKWISGIAASVATLLMIGYWMLFQTPTNVQIFQENFQAYDNIVSVRSTDQSTFLTGMKFYSMGEYQRALEIFATVEKSDGQNIDLLFYSGVSQLAVNDPAQAVTSFIKIVDSKYYQQVKWYLALSYIAINDLKAAQISLESIGAEEYKFSEAEGILKLISDQTD